MCQKGSLASFPPPGKSLLPSCLSKSLPSWAPWNSSRDSTAQGRESAWPAPRESQPSQYLWTATLTAVCQSWWHKQGQAVTNGLTCIWQGSRPLRNMSENWTIVLLTKVLTSHICKEIFLKLGGRADLVLDPLCLAKFTSVISKGFGLTRFLVLLSDPGWPSEGPISSLYLN